MSNTQSNITKNWYVKNGRHPFNTVRPVHTRGSKTKRPRRRPPPSPRRSLPPPPILLPKNKYRLRTQTGQNVYVRSLYNNNSWNNNGANAKQLRALAAEMRNTAKNRSNYRQKSRKVQRGGNNADKLIKRNKKQMLIPPKSPLNQTRNKPLPTSPTLKFFNNRTTWRGVPQ